MIKNIIIILLAVFVLINNLQLDDKQKLLDNYKHDFKLCEVDNSILKTKARIDARNILYDQVSGYFNYCYWIATAKSDKKEIERYKQFMDCNISKLQ